MRRHHLLAVASVAALGLTACGDGTDTTGTGGSDPAVAFTSPQDGETVSSPFSWDAEAENVTVEPAGEVNEDAGHLHVLVDQDCVTPGETIGKDEGQNHFGDGSTSGELELEAGEHTLCLQLADGEHTALDITDTITVTVE